MNKVRDTLPDPDFELGISPEKVFYVIAKSRIIEAKTPVVEPDPGSNMSDDDMREILEAYADDESFNEIKDYIDSLNEEEQEALVALMWVGRGSFSKDEWAEAVDTADAEHNDYTSTYLLGTPLLSDYLESGLNEFGISVEDLELDHL